MLYKPNRKAQIDLLNPLSKNLVAYWIFTEGSGGVCFDLMRVYRGALHGGSSWGVGTKGQALEVDGTDGRALVDSAIRESAPMTVNVWFVPFTIGLSDSTLFSIGNTISDDHGFELQFNDSQTRWRTRGQGITRSAEVPLPPVLGQYCMATGVEHHSSLRNCYLNGSSKATNELSRIPGSLDNTSIGCRKRTTEGNFVHGLIDSVMVFDRALTDMEVWWLYNNPYGLIKPAQYQPSYFIFDWPAIEYFSITFVDTTEFEWHSTAEFLWDIPGLTIPENVAVVVDSLSQATVTWSLVADADAYMVEAQVGAVGAVPANVSVVLDSNTQATITWDENEDFTQLRVRARVRAGKAEE